MRAWNVVVIGIIVACSAVALGQTGAGPAAPPGQEGRGRGGGRGEGATAILQAAPTDRAVSMSLETLKGYYADMDAKKRQTLRMLEGGRYNVNIRRITNAETGLVHPNTADVWVVTEGSGMLTTGGRLENGKIIGGETHPIKPGDVEFIPAGVPHGVSGVTGSITWLNIRFDTNN
jgi:mannose-6-phosphate isomerase-like protein (cupin superfamily)